MAILPPLRDSASKQGEHMDWWLAEAAFRLVELEGMRVEDACDYAAKLRARMPNMQPIEAVDWYLRPIANKVAAPST